MNLLQQLETAIAEPRSAFRPLSIYEATMIPDASAWAAVRRAKAEVRTPGQLTRLKRIKRALERDVVDQFRQIQGVKVYENDNWGNRFPLTLADGLIHDELVGVVYGLPGREREHLAIVVDLISVEDYVDAVNAEKSGNNKHFHEWETMAGMFASGAHVNGAVLVLICVRSADWFIRFVDRDDEKIEERLEQISDFMEIEGTPENVRSSLGGNAVAVTCRTCRHCHASGATGWVCDMLVKKGGDGVLSESTQAKSNECHIIDPVFLPLEFLDHATDTATWYKSKAGDIIEVLAECEDQTDASLVDRCITSREAASLSGSIDFYDDPLISEMKSKLSAKVQ